SVATIVAPPANAQPAPRAVIAGSAAPAGGPTSAMVPAAGGAEVSFEVALDPRNIAGAQALALAVSTPGSPSYRKFLTPAQWEAEFSPTPSEVQEVSTWLRSQGLRVRSVTPDRLAIEVSGRTARVEGAFDTTLGYRAVHGGQFLAAEHDLSVPSSLAGLVGGTIGLNEVPASPDRAAGSGTGGARGRATRTRTALASSAAKIGPPPATVTATPCGSYYGQEFDTAGPPFGHGYASPLPDVVCGYTPGQMRAAYDLGSTVAAGDNGSGQSVAVIDAYASPTLLADAQQYARQNDPSYPLSSSQFSETVAHRYGQVKACQASEWFDEQSLDVEAVHAIAPDAHIVYVGAKNCTSGLYDSLRTVIDEHSAEVVSASWGDNAGDLLDDAGTRNAVDNMLTMADDTGVSVLFASGDNGDEFSALGVDSPDFPASSPWVTAVGGTTLQLGFGVGEVAWSTATSTLCTAELINLAGCTSGKVGTWLPLTFDEGSGGGTSYQYSQPPYQIGVVPSAMADRDAAEVGSNAMRVVPDISMDADPGTGFLEGLTQSFPDGVRYGQVRSGGTSLSTPLFAGVVALADQAAGGSLGFLNPALYGMRSADPAVIIDVVPRGALAQDEVSYADGIDASGGLISTTRVDDYQGVESYCTSTGCTSRPIILSARAGYDDMTGLGTPGPGFVPALVASADQGSH
ncbi:MAG TPA: S53 family peptidase, partial [Acidimicrobiales bacterium]|nr:S53 family peptidase [Acidimicrobiales bacterium]